MPNNGMPYQEVTPENIDPLIFPLCKAINGTGMLETRASCQGHLNPLTLDYSSPYISFRGNIEFIEKLEGLIYERTELPWYIDAHFGEDRKLWFGLRLNENPFLFKTFFKRFIGWKSFEKTKTRDFEKIQNLIEEIRQDFSVNKHN